MPCPVPANIAQYHICCMGAARHCFVCSRDFGGFDKCAWLERVSLTQPIASTQTEMAGSEDTRAILEALRADRSTARERQTAMERQIKAEAKRLRSGGDAREPLHVQPLAWCTHTINVASYHAFATADKYISGF